MKEWAMDLDAETIGALAAAVVVVLGGIGATFGKMYPLLKSTDNAVNHGRLEGMEADLKAHIADSASELQALKQHIDRNEQANDDRHRDVSDRLDKLMIALIDK